MNNLNRIKDFLWEVSSKGFSCNKLKIEIGKELNKVLKIDSNICWKEENGYIYSQLLEFKEKCFKIKINYEFRYAKLIELDRKEI